MCIHEKCQNIQVMSRFWKTIESKMTGFKKLAIRDEKQWKNGIHHESIKKYKMQKLIKIIFFLICDTQSVCHAVRL